MTIKTTEKVANNELHSMYTIFEYNATLYIRHAKHGTIELQQLYNDIFTGNWPVNSIEIERSEIGEI